MSRYRITETSFIDNRLVSPGEEVSVDARLFPAELWHPLDASARKASSKAGFTAPAESGADSDGGLREPGSL